ALPPESEAWLITLCSQLAHIVADMPVTLQGAHINSYVRAVRGSSGVAIGHAVLCDHGELFSVSDEPCPDIKAALQDWHALLEKVKREIHEEESALGAHLPVQASSIFHAYSS